MRRKSHLRPTKQTNVMLSLEARANLKELASSLHFNRSELFENIGQGRLKVLTQETIERLQNYLAELNGLYRDELKGRGLWRKSAPPHRKQILKGKIAEVDHMLAQLKTNVPAVLVSEPGKHLQVA